MKPEILFEAVPYAKNASECYAAKCLEKLCDAINGMKNVSRINIPEVVEENHLGLPYYRNTDIRDFAVRLRDACKKDVMLNTVCVHHKTDKLFEQWIDESVHGYNIRNFVFVGGKSNSFRYSGPDIIKADSIARGKKINFGNIFIPNRPNECERLVSKTMHGCSFFTTQVLFEHEKGINVINEYLRKCEKLSLKPAKIFLSFSPISTTEDITFVKWLGAELNEKTEQRLAHSKDIGNESIKVILEAYSKFLDFFGKTGQHEHLGLNIAYLTLHNLNLAAKLAKHIFINKN